MATSTREDYDPESQSSSLECVPSNQHYPSSDSLPQWRLSEQVENGTPSTSPFYWDTDEDDNSGLRPFNLFGKHTWRIDNFTQINKRELRSDAFEIGGHKWYILIYPQGCDVCNHLSLFLCVANHDKLLPGWSHFAQFTIAVVNKDSKKSKYSDTLHRFWKKEHDWGWKKFMELSKVCDGFLVDNALVIKAQVQVIRERTDRPFRCLDWQYRRELVRVYLSNVEQLCRRFVEEKRGKFGKMLEDKVRWSGFYSFWLEVDQSSRRRMSRDKSEMILKGIIKHFFIENEVTSTLVMDYLYNGLKVLEFQSQNKESRTMLLEMEETPAPFVFVEKDLFVLTDDILLLLQRSVSEPLPPKDEMNSQNQNRVKNEGSFGEELSKDSVDRDEIRLTELGRRTVEIFALNHIFSRIEVAYQEAVALKRQEELIREEEAGQAENEVKSKRIVIEKEKRTKKKQTKQKKGSRKGRDRGRDEKHDIVLQKSQMRNNSREKMLEENKGNGTLSALGETKISADVSDLSDIGDDNAELHQLGLEAGGSNPMNWETDASESCRPVDADPQKEQSDKKNLYVMDDSSSTCSTDSDPSIVMNGPSTTNGSLNNRNFHSHIRGKIQENRCTSYQNDQDLSCVDKPQAKSTLIDTTHLCDATESCSLTSRESEVMSLNNQTQQQEQELLKEEVQKKTRNNGQVDFIGSSRLATTEQSCQSSPTTCQQSKQTSERRVISTAPVTARQSSPSSICLSEKFVSTVTSSPFILKPEMRSTVSKKSNSANQASVELRSLSAPLSPVLRPITSTASEALVVPQLSCSVSSSSLSVDPSSTQGSVAQSYQNEIMSGKKNVGTKAQGLVSPSSSCSLSSETSAYCGTSRSITPPSAYALEKFAFGSVKPEAFQSQSPLEEDYLDVDTNRSTTNSHLVHGNAHAYIGGLCHRTHCLDELSGLSFHQTQGLSAAQDDFPHLDIINDLLNEEQCVGGAADREYYHHHHHETLNRPYIFGDDATIEAVNVMSNDDCTFVHADHYSDDQRQGFYGGSSGPLQGWSHLTSAPLDLPVYVNGQNGGMLQNQWPPVFPGHSVRRLWNLDPSGYAFHLPDYLKFGLWVERI